MIPNLIPAGDGTSLACWDLGGEGVPLLAVHGTGLHALCWTPMAEHLRSRFHVYALDLRGHGASGRSQHGSYDWHLFAGDVLAVMDGLGLDDVVGVGHSCGGATLLLSSVLAPGRFRALWVWEPIMAMPGGSITIERASAMAERARGRRSVWAGRDEAREHFEGRGMFASFAPEALDAYLAIALFERPDGTVALACDPSVESAVYEGAPLHDAWSRLGDIACPVRVIGGLDDPSISPGACEQIASRISRGGSASLAGVGHFGPFERPDIVATDIIAWSDGLAE